MKIGILTGGGDAPGLNAAIRAVGRRSLFDGHTVVGIRNGWAGLLGDGDIVSLGRPAFSGILPVGGTVLGSSRVNPMKREGGREEVLRNLQHHDLEALVAIGGDDTLSVAAWLAEHGAAVVGVPKTMDNDLLITEYCIGFDSAVSVVTEPSAHHGDLASPGDGLRGDGARHRLGRGHGWSCRRCRHDHHPRVPGHARRGGGASRRAPVRGQ